VLRWSAEALDPSAPTFGAGGIGLQIAERIKVRFWDEVSFTIIRILATVALIDIISS
jgi:phosphonate transport system permease protein